MWSDARKRIKRSLADVLDLPGEVTLDIPRLVLLGNLRATIENHRGITEYTGEVVRVALAAGEIRITGRDLVLRTLLPDEVCVEGQIDRVEFL
ncbi:MAG: sporulation protein YqfC [Bacillota bacterium]